MTIQRCFLDFTKQYNMPRDHGFHEDWRPEIAWINTPAENK